MSYDSRQRCVYMDENSGDIWPGVIIKARPDLGTDFADIVIFTNPARQRPEDSTGCGVCFMGGVEQSVSNSYPPDVATFHLLT